MFTREHGPQPRQVGPFSIDDTTPRRTFDVKGTRHTPPQAPDAAPGDVDSRPPAAPRTAERGRSR
jgi:hypothetical protein